MCSRCGESKRLEEFHRSSGHKDGHKPHCGQCGRNASAAWRQTNPEGLRNWQHRNLHGITIERYGEMLAAQGGGCAICGSYQGARDGRRLAVDHDHRCCPDKRSCGKCVRGLLCVACNNGLGRFGDDPDRIRRALAYVIEWHEGKLPVQS